MLIYSKELLYKKSGVRELQFIQPTLSANGTMGGDSFAVSASRTAQSTTAAWRAFDNNSSTRWGGGTTQYPVYITMYNPYALRVISIALTNWYARTFTSGDILAGNDTDNLITIVSGWTNSVAAQGSTWTIDVNSQYYYKYWRINFLSGGFSSTYGQSLTQIDLNAKYIA